jgi:hypothetical protein
VPPFLEGALSFRKFNSLVSNRRPEFIPVHNIASLQTNHVKYFVTIYSAVSTAVAVNQDGTLTKITAPDPDIPKGVKGAKWDEIPEIWKGAVARLSRTMVGKPASAGCQLRAARLEGKRAVLPWAALITKYFGKQKSLTN